MVRCKEIRKHANFATFYILQKRRVYIYIYWVKRRVLKIDLYQYKFYRWSLRNRVLEQIYSESEGEKKGTYNILYQVSGFVPEQDRENFVAASAVKTYLNII